MKGDSQGSLASRDVVVNQDKRVTLAPAVCLDYKVSPEMTDFPELKESLVARDPQDLRDYQDRTDSLDYLE